MYVDCSLVLRDGSLVLRDGSLVCRCVLGLLVKRIGVDREEADNMYGACVVMARRGGKMRSCGRMMSLEKRNDFPHMCWMR